ncbi:hypothetical protein BGZ73_005590 [Actinomortierella ambigua]|nr:hypothetical protein BGZ73_005590 [Actinomortierella ambigua]
MSDPSASHPTKEPFSDPSPPKQSVRQSVVNKVALPLAAAGGAIAEVGIKVKELITGEHSKIDTDHHDHHKPSFSSSSSSSSSALAHADPRDDPASRSQSASNAD